MGPQLDTHCNAVWHLFLHDPIRPLPVPAPSHADLRLRTSDTALRHNKTCFTCPLQTAQIRKAGVNVDTWHMYGTWAAAYTR